MSLGRGWPDSNGEVGTKNETLLVRSQQRAVQVPALVLL